MSCLDVAEKGQSEFDFFQQLTYSKEVYQCAGPITRIGFTAPALKEVQKLIDDIGLDSNYLDRYDPEVLDSAHLSLAMCPKHWMQHSLAMATKAEQENNDLWEQLAYYVFRVVCLSNEWDYKEVLNYTKTASTLKGE